MSALGSFSPYPSLAQRVIEAREVERAHRAPGRFRRWARRVVISVAVIFAVLGGGAGTAQAWPWDSAVENIGAYVSNFCEPENLPALSDGSNIDNAFGLNEHREGYTKTIAPDVSKELARQSGKASDRINTYYDAAGGDKHLVAKPTYKRYGFETLRWTNYGAGCFSLGYWFSGITNFALFGLVHLPTILAMAALQFAMDNVLYDVFGVIIQPIVAAFTAIFKPWILFLAPIGVFWAFIRSKGALQPTLKAAVWVICILGVLLWMRTHTSTFVTKANNFVTEFAASASCKFSEQTQSRQCDPNDPMGEIMQALWYGVPYQVWLSGEVGDEQARVDKDLTSLENGGGNKVGLGPAILNGMYVDPSDPQNVVKGQRDWDSRSYQPEGDGTKTASWTGGYDDNYSGNSGAPWRHVPFLATVKFLCNDITDGDDNTKDPGKNRWMYGGSCDPATAGTTAMMQNFTGQAYSQQMITAFAGGVSALAVLLAVGVCAMYLALQKMLFYFLLAFAPIFLAISTFADEKRRQFAIRFFEVLLANLIKQCAAVCAVLFVSHSMSTLLFPTEPGLPDIPWILKPFFAILFFIALLMFAIPMKNLMKAAVAGDTSVVDKTANAPVNAAKTVGKAAVVAGAVAATGGAAAAAAPGLLGAGGAAAGAGGMAKGASMLTRAGAMMGTRGGVGKTLNVAGKGLNLASKIGQAQAQRSGVKRAVSAGTEMLLNGQGGGKYRDAQGNVTAAGRAQAEKDFKAMTKAGERAGRPNLAAMAQQKHMDKFFKGHQALTGQTHPNDPRNGQAVAGAGRTGPGGNGNGRRNDGRGETGPVPTSDFTGSNGNGSAPTGQGRQQPSQQYYAGRAREMVSGPEFGRNEDIRAQINLRAADVLSTSGLSRGEVEADPTRLLTSSAYGGGDTTRMDPMHPATESLTNLRFAAASGDEQATQVAVLQASEVISQHGVPNDIGSIRTYGESAQSFESTNVVGAMPNLTENSSWQERAEGAVTMQAAISQMPAEHPAADAMQSYVSALSTPSVDMGTVDALKAQAIESFEQVQPSTPVASIDAGPSAPAQQSGGLFEPPPVDHGPPAGGHSDPPPRSDWNDQPPSQPYADPQPQAQPQQGWSEPGGQQGWSEPGGQQPWNEPAPQSEAPRPQADPSTTQPIDPAALADAVVPLLDRMANSGADRAVDQSSQMTPDQVRDAVAQGIRDGQAEGGAATSGPATRADGDAGFFGGPTNESTDPDPVMPLGEEGDDPTMPYRRSRRRRRSGLYQYDDDEEDLYDDDDDEAERR